jgi:tetratricopeptide (TPR) repeat protein
MVDDVTRLYDHGIAHVRASDPGAALPFFEQAAVLMPENPHIWWALGMTAHQLGMWERTREALGRTVALGCVNGRICAKLSHALDRLGQPGAAAREAERALSFPLDPETQAYLHRALGYYYVERDDEEAALRHYQAAIALEPDEANAQHNLGILHLRRDRFAEAVPHLARAAELLPEDASTWYHLGRAARHAGDLGTARAALERVLVLRDDPFARLELAAALISLGRGKDAARHLRHTLRSRLDRQSRAWACALLARCKGRP